MQKNIILFGSPGSGKTTQVDMLRESGLDFELLSVGRMLRAIAESKTDLGRKVKKEMATGDLVDPRMVDEVVKNALDEVPKSKMIIFDGYPRTLEQVYPMEKILKDRGLDMPTMIVIKINREEAIKRLTTRRVCSVCKTSFSVEDLRDESKCNKCDGEIIQRDDDREDAINTRFELFDMQDSIMEHYFSKLGKYVVVDGMGDEKMVHKSLMEAISKINDSKK